MQISQHLVNLISVTPDAEKQILYCARVSSDQSNEGSGLLRYLIRNKHWSPFEMAHMVVEIVTSRAIAQQILRHRSFSFQEFSQRYSEAPGHIAYFGRYQSEQGNRQSSTDWLSEADSDWWFQAQGEIAQHAFDIYTEAISRGIARECARFVLPLSTATKLYMSGTLRSWIHYFDLRCDEHTQHEHRWIAFDIKDIFCQEFPTIASALWDKPLDRN